MYQFTAYDTTKLGAKAVAKQLKSALQDYHGTLSGIVIQHIRLENELSTLDTSPDGTIKTYTTDLEFEISYDRS